MSYTVAAGDLRDDRASILSVWDGSLRRADAQWYRWIYEDNPFGPVRCWLLRDAPEGAVSGTATVFPRTLWGMGRPWRAGVTGDFAVTKAHRALGPALMLQKAIAHSCSQNEYDVVYGFPNRPSQAVQVRAGFTDLGPAIEYRKMLRSAGALGRRYGALARVAAPLLDAAMLVAERRLLRSPEPFLFSETTRFDERFDDFWQRMRPAVPLTGERTSAYLSWRCSDCPNGGYRTLVMQHADSGAMAGYVVWCVRDDEVVIADLLAEDSTRGLAALAARLVDRARELRVSSVRARYFGAPERLGALRRLGFRATDSGGHVVMCVSPAAPAPALLDRNNWYLLEGDADL